MVTTQEQKKYQAYYTKSAQIVDYMVSSLSINSNDKVFEPCGGDGVFVEAILSENNNISIDVNELNETAYSDLCYKFKDHVSIHINNTDTLLDDGLALKASFGGYYDKIIANPPYGAWQDYDKRETLKKIYNGAYTKETYSLFLYRCIGLLKEGGRLCFIIPDTFLNLHAHTYLRNFILSETKIKELSLIPSSFFPGVNFGYANLAIITLEKHSRSHECLSNNFNIYNNFKNVHQLADIYRDKSLNSYSFKQNDIHQNPDHALFLNSDSQIVECINSAVKKVGDIASCVTGFYSGNDKIYLRSFDLSAKNSKKYSAISSDEICLSTDGQHNILDGINTDRHFVPIVKGGNVKYLKPDQWFMDWSSRTVHHYKKDKKARFQNSQFYFKYGLGIPMISSSSITASLIENKLFDQSIVGIFPHDKSITKYLLAFFNSPTCNKLIRTINPSANNPANYIKKIPFVSPTDEQKQRINLVIDEIISSIQKGESYNEGLEITANEIIKSIYGF